MQCTANADVLLRGVEDQYQFCQRHTAKGRRNLDKAHEANVPRAIMSPQSANFELTEMSDRAFGRGPRQIGGGRRCVGPITACRRDMSVNFAKRAYASRACRRSRAGGAADWGTGAAAD